MWELNDDDDDDDDDLIDVIILLAVACYPSSLELGDDMRLRAVG